ncbi:MAG TPA: DUF1801 domain-containing protein [Trueperaceae bacterium]
MAKSEAKFRPVDVEVSDLVASVENETRREDAKALIELLGEVTGAEPRVWHPSIIGFGDHHWRHESGREGDGPLLAFAPRKSNLVFYGFSSAPESAELLSRLGKHKLGKSCMYINKLADVDTDVLRELAEVGVKHFGGTSDSLVPR